MRSGDAWSQSVVTTSNVANGLALLGTMLALHWDSVMNAIGSRSVMEDTV